MNYHLKNIIDRNSNEKLLDKIYCYSQGRGWHYISAIGYDFDLIINPAFPRDTHRLLHSLLKRNGFD